MVDVKWTEFYQEFANALLPYINDRATLIQKLQAVYTQIGVKFPRVESGDEVIDIDPFTIYCFFNKGITDANRISIASGLAKAFGIKAPVPTVFDGLPVLNNMNATYYLFKEDRGEHDIDMLWDVFAAAIAFTDKADEESRSAFISAYNNVKDLKGNRWKLSMALDVPCFPAPVLALEDILTCLRHSTDLLFHNFDTASDCE